MATDRRLLPGILAAAVLTGLSDGTFSGVLSVWFYNSSFARLWKGVASVLIGPNAFNGGTSIILLGIAMHFGVALTWSTILALAVAKFGGLRRQLIGPLGVLKIAAVYGPLIWMTMSLIVIPTLAHRPPSITSRWWTQLIGHIPFVALPMAFAIRHAFTGTQISNPPSPVRPSNRSS